MTTTNLHKNLTKFRNQKKVLTRLQIQSSFYTHVKIVVEDFV